MGSLCPVLDAYLGLVDDTESPILYHRWCFITAVAAMLARRTKFRMATGDIYPNMYTVLMGPPGARKSTAIRKVSELVKAAGYTHIASGKTSPEQFLVDLGVGFDTVALQSTDFTELPTFDIAAPASLSSHCLIRAPELQTFLGQSNLTFISLLTDLWDNPADYPYRIKTGYALISNPTVSLLGGATQTTFKKIFPVEILGQGQLSRLILVHGAGVRKKVFDPKPADAAVEKSIIEILTVINSGVAVPPELAYTEAAYAFSKLLYETGESEIQDVRFQYYISRRYDHYVKVAMVIAVLNAHDMIELEDCLLANTILTYTEKFMPVALGEFGLDAASEKTEQLYHIVQQHPNGLTLEDLMTASLSIFHGSTGELASHLTRLKVAKRIDRLDIGGVIYYIPIIREVISSSGLVNFELLAEYRENPTFSTSIYESEDADELAVQLEKELAALKMETKFKAKNSKLADFNPDLPFEI